MDDKDRATLINLQTSKAERFLSQAKDMQALGLWDLAANRYYYACFHIVQALFIKDGVVGHTHAGVVSQFSLYYVKTGRLSRLYGSFLARLMQLRQKADYNCAYEITEDELKSIAPTAVDFVEDIRKFIK